jgi:hypothetical protein
MEALIVVSVIVGAGFFAGFMIRDREERRRRRLAKRLNLT